MDTASILEQYTQDLSNLPAELAHLLSELRDKDMKYYETRKRIQQRDNQIHKYIKQFGSLTKNPKEEQIYNKIDEDFDKANVLQEEKCILSNTALFLITKHLTRLENDIETLENEGLLAPLELLEQELSLTSSLSSITNFNSSSMKLTSSTHKRQPSSRKNQHNHHHHHHHHQNSQTPGGSQQPLSNSVSRNSTPSFSTPTAPPTGSTTTATTATTAVPPGMRPILPPSSTKRETSEEFNSDSDIVPRRKLAVPPPNLVLLSSMHPKSLEVQMSTTGPNSNGGEEDELYCFCRQVSFGNMIACDNSNCKFEWFHYDCVGLKEPPQGTWYCPDCAKIMLNKKGRKKK